MTNEILKPEEIHSPYGGSQAHRWIRCPGSIQMCADLPKDGGSSAAARGTALHEVGAACIKQFSYRASDSEIKAVADSLSIDTGYVANMEDIESVRDYFDYVHDLKLCGYNQIWIEKQVSLPWIDPLVRGTLDIGLLSEGRRVLAIGDYKTGVGPVMARDNEQLMMYALGQLAAENLLSKVDTIRMFIVQPTLINWESNSFDMSAADLVQWGRDVLEPAYRFTKHPDAPLVPGEKQCVFCKAKGVCSARANSLLPEQVKQGGALPEPASLTPDQIADILDKAEMFKSWIKDVYEYAETGIRLGTLKIPGFGMVEKPGRKNREWMSGAVESLSLMYGFDVFELKSVAAIEKQLGKDGKEFIKTLVKINQGNPSFKLTKTDSPANVSAVDDFTAV